MITPDETINQAYAELLDTETKQKKPKAMPMYRDKVYCCVCEKDISDLDYLRDLTDEEYLMVLHDNNEYCGGSPRCCP